MAKLKKALKALIPYIIALIVGLILMWICTPYAKAHRADPTLTGGEVCLPLLTVAAVALIKHLPREIRELNHLANETDEDDY